MKAIDTLLLASLVTGGRSFLCKFRRVFTVACLLAMATVTLVFSTLVAAQSAAPAPITQNPTKTPTWDELSDTDPTKPKTGASKSPPKSEGRLIDLDTLKAKPPCTNPYDRFNKPVKCDVEAYDKAHPEQKLPSFDDFMAEKKAAEEAKRVAETKGEFTRRAGLFDDLLYPVKPQETSLASFPVGSALLTTILVTLLAGIVGYFFYRIAGGHPYKQIMA